MKKKHGYCKWVLALALLTMPVLTAQGADVPIKIGGIYSYTGLPQYIVRAQKAAQMAVEEQNAAGGVHGRSVVLLMRDDKYRPEEAARVAEELISRDKVDVLVGQSTTHLALSVANVARKNGMPYFAAWCGEESCVQSDKDVVFTLDQKPSSVFDALAQESAKMKAQRWALLAPNIGYGMMAVKNLEAAFPVFNPKAQIVDKEIYIDGKAHFDSIIRAMQMHHVDGVISAVYGKDFDQYLIAAQKLGFLKQAVQANTYMPPENMEETGAKTPKGWLVVGYPQEALKTPAHQAFLDKFKKKYGIMPGLSGILSYIDTKLALAALEKAPATLKPEEIAAAGRGLSIETPVGKVTLDAQTQHSDLGYWLGYTDVVAGKPQLMDFYRTGEKK